MRYALVFSVFFAFASFSLAADISGKWTGEMHMGGGGSEQPVEVTFTLQVDGGKVTGTVASERGEFPIQDGKLEGDTLLFAIDADGSQINYDGLIQDDGINFLADFVGRGRTDQFLAVRAK